MAQALAVDFGFKEDAALRGLRRCQRERESGRWWGLKAMGPSPFPPGTEEEVKVKDTWDVCRGCPLLVAGDIPEGCHVVVDKYTIGVAHRMRPRSTIAKAAEGETVEVQPGETAALEAEAESIAAAYKADKTPPQPGEWEVLPELEMVRAIAATARERGLTVVARKVG